MHCEKVERRSRVSEVAVGDAVLPPRRSKPLLSSTSPTSLASTASRLWARLATPLAGLEASALLISQPPVNNPHYRSA